MSKTFNKVNSDLTPKTSRNNNFFKSPVIELARTSYRRNNSVINLIRN